MQVSWVPVNCPSCFCESRGGKAKGQQWEHGQESPGWADTPVLTLRKESSRPFPMYSITIIMVLPAQTDHQHHVSAAITQAVQTPQGLEIQVPTPALPGFWGR